MNPARAVILAILAVALAVGAAVFYLQEYAYYRELSPEANEGFELTLAGGGTELVPAAGFQGIDASSSPIRYRACLRLPSGDASRFQPYVGATPLNAPRWFGCFDARAVGEALEAGEARAVLGERGVVEGVDRVVAIFPDGRAFAWHQIDPCGALVEPDEREPFCPPAPGPLDAAPATAVEAPPPAAVPPSE